MDERRCRPCFVARPVCRLRFGPGAAFQIAGGLSAGADRQCAGQFHSRGPVDGGVGRRHAWVKRPAFSALRWRYISSRPLTEDGVFRSPATEHHQRPRGYRFANGWRIQLDALNLLNSTSYNASYAYGALLTTDTCSPSAFPPRKFRWRSARTDLWTIRCIPWSLWPFGLRSPDPSIIDVYRMAAELGRAVPPPRPHRLITIRPGSISAASANSVGREPVAAPRSCNGHCGPSPNGNLPNWHGGIQLGFDYMSLPICCWRRGRRDLRRKKTITILTRLSPPPTGPRYSTGDVRGRLGYAFDNMLLYGTAGWVWSNNQYVHTQLTGALNNATAGSDRR